MATKKRVSRLRKHYATVTKARHFGRSYLIGASVILALTTLLWATLSAIVHLGNADQLVNTYLVESPDTFFNAIFPDQHSFLMKLPFFLLIHSMGGGPAEYTLVSILVVLLTVGAFAWLLSRIERRPIVLGTLFLAVSLSLLLIPAQPYAGGILPVNMGMVATRNLEYIVFIVSLYFVVRMRRFRTPAFFGAILLLTLLFASDKLFIPLSLGGGAFLLVMSLIVHRRDLVRVAVHWLGVTIVSITASVGALLLLNAAHVLNTTSALGTGPYGLVSSIKDFGIGVFYAVAGIFTNFGANPVVDVRVIKDIPGELLTHLANPTAISFLISFVVTIVILVIMIKTVITSLRPQPLKRTKPVVPTKGFLLSLMLIWVSVTAIGVYVFSHHYYPVDARYEAIIFFAGFISLAQYFRSRRLTRERVVLVGAVLILGIILTIPFVISSFNASQQAGDDLKQRNELIIKNLSVHPVDTLVGDYWRVIPIKLETTSTQQVLPMGSCTTPRDILTSRSWLTDLTNHSFAYVVTLDTGMTDFPACSLEEIVATYGQPNQTAVIKGEITNPKELLLFYDHGIVSPTTSPQQQSRQLDTILPIALGSLPDPTCTQPTTMNFVAHEDDDILFMNPDLSHAIDAGNCIRTVFLTAGDAGNPNKLYWLGRQKGAESAYDKMIGHPDQLWNDRTVIMPTGQFATVANPRGNRSISLIFLHLPDGNPNGTGYTTTQAESLSKLSKGSINTITTVDHHSTYSATQLTDTLATLMQFYQPDAIRSQSSYDQGPYRDHSDHITVPYFVDKARQTYKQSSLVDIPTTYYMGYPIHSLPENVSGAELSKKAATFFAFSAFDEAVCRSMQQCDTRAVYGSYLRRQYTSPN